MPTSRPLLNGNHKDEKQGVDQMIPIVQDVISTPDGIVNDGINVDRHEFSPAKPNSNSHEDQKVITLKSHTVNNLLLPKVEDQMDDQQSSNSKQFFEPDELSYKSAPQDKYLYEEPYIDEEETKRHAKQMRDQAGKTGDNFFGKSKLLESHPLTKSHRDNNGEKQRREPNWDEISNRKHQERIIKHLNSSLKKKRQDGNSPSIESDGGRGRPSLKKRTKKEIDDSALANSLNNFPVSEMEQPKPTKITSRMFSPETLYEADLQKYQHGLGSSQNMNQENKDSTPFERSQIASKNDKKSPSVNEDKEIDPDDNVNDLQLLVNKGFKKQGQPLFQQYTKAPTSQDQSKKMDKSLEKNAADFTLQAQKETDAIDREAPAIEIEVSTPQTGMSKQTPQSLVSSVQIQLPRDFNTSHANQQMSQKGEKGNRENQVGEESPPYGSSSQGGRQDQKSEFSDTQPVPSVKSSDDHDTAGAAYLNQKVSSSHTRTKLKRVVESGHLGLAKGQRTNYGEFRIDSRQTLLVDPNHLNDKKSQMHQTMQGSKNGSFAGKFGVKHDPNFLRDAQSSRGDLNQSKNRKSYFNEMIRHNSQNAKSDQSSDYGANNVLSMRGNRKKQGSTILSNSKQLMEGTIEQESTKNGNIEVDPAELLQIPKVIQKLPNKTNSLVTFAGGADTRRNQQNQLSPQKEKRPSTEAAFQDYQDALASYRLQHSRGKPSSPVKYEDQSPEKQMDHQHQSSPISRRSLSHSPTKDSLYGRSSLKAKMGEETNDADEELRRKRITRKISQSPTKMAGSDISRISSPTRIVNKNSLVREPSQNDPFLAENQRTHDQLQIFSDQIQNESAEQPFLKTFQDKHNMTSVSGNRQQSKSKLFNKVQQNADQMEHDILQGNVQNANDVQMVSVKSPSSGGTNQVGQFLSRQQFGNGNTGHNLDISGHPFSQQDNTNNIGGVGGHNDQDTPLTQQINAAQNQFADHARQTVQSHYQMQQHDHSYFNQQKTTQREQQIQSKLKQQQKDQDDMQVTIEVPHELTGDSRQSANRQYRMNTEVGRDSQESRERRKNRRGLEAMSRKLTSKGVLSDKQSSIDRSSQNNYQNYEQKASTASKPVQQHHHQLLHGETMSIGEADYNRIGNESYSAQDKEDDGVNFRNFGSFGGTNPDKIKVSQKSKEMLQKIYRHQSGANFTKHNNHLNSQNRVGYTEPDQRSYDSREHGPAILALNGTPENPVLSDQRSRGTNSDLHNANLVFNINVGDGLTKHEDYPHQIDFNRMQRQQTEAQNLNKIMLKGKQPQKMQKVKSEFPLDKHMLTQRTQKFVPNPQMMQTGQSNPILNSHHQQSTLKNVDSISNHTANRNPAMLKHNQQAKSQIDTQSRHNYQNVQQMIPDPTRQSEFELNLMQVQDRTADRGFDVSDNASYVSGPGATAAQHTNFGKRNSIAHESQPETRHHHQQQFYRHEMSPQKSDFVTPDCKGSVGRNFQQINAQGSADNKVRSSLRGRFMSTRSIDGQLVSNRKSRFTLAENQEFDAKQSTALNILNVKNHVSEHSPINENLAFGRKEYSVSPVRPLNLGGQSIVSLHQSNSVEKMRRKTLHGGPKNSLSIADPNTFDHTLQQRVSLVDRNKMSKLRQNYEQN